MKIISQTPDKIVLKVGNLNLFIGSVFLIAGLLIGTFTAVAPGMPILFPIIFFGVFGGIGLVMILTGSSYVITFEKSQKQITYLKKSILRQQCPIVSFRGCYQN